MLFFSSTKSSIVLSVASMIVNEITGFTPPIFGPTATASGESTFSPDCLFVCCNNHPYDALNDTSRSLLSKIWLPEEYLISDVRSGSGKLR